MALVLAPTVAPITVSDGAITSPPVDFTVTDVLPFGTALKSKSVEPIKPLMEVGKKEPVHTVKDEKKK
jgi:hypothetical protein